MTNYHSCPSPINTQAGASAAKSRNLSLV